MDIINFIIYLAITFSGTVFGSFFTLAVHRIPKHQDITHERSYCPNCNHKLQFLDLIPVFSYIFLGGKCRYCKEKIRPRYLILELCSGAVFFTLAVFRGINYSTFINFETEWPTLMFFFIDILFLCAIFITAGIDKEYKKIPNSIIIYGLVICIFKVFMQLILLSNNSQKFNFSNYLQDEIEGAIIPMVVLTLAIFYATITKKDNLPIGIGDLKYLTLLGLFFGFVRLDIGVLFAMLIILFSFLIKIVKGLARKEKDVFKQIMLEKEIPLGFYLAIPFTLLMILFPMQ